MAHAAGKIMPEMAEADDLAPEMVAAGAAALLRLVSEDDLRNDPHEIVRQILKAAHGVEPPSGSDIQAPMP
jgi:hypothetical protein